MHDYIAQDNPAAAEEVVSGIYQRAQILLDSPEIGYEYISELEGGRSVYPSTVTIVSYRISDLG
ncbi:MAG: hypothetical protein WAV32_09890 [Halobacteriota archaeon]